jgi:hypothetical protein
MDTSTMLSAAGEREPSCAGLVDRGPLRLAWTRHEMFADSVDQMSRRNGRTATPHDRAKLFLEARAIRARIALLEVVTHALHLGRGQFAVQERL